jgi:hypothetical protein
MERRRPAAVGLTAASAHLARGTARRLLAGTCLQSGGDCGGAASLALASTVSFRDRRWVPEEYDANDPKQTQGFRSTTVVTLKRA